MAIDAQTIASHAAQYLRHEGFPDYSAAFNGLQLEGVGAVGRIGAAVDACEWVIVEAVRRKVGLLLVHHGLMWDRHGFAFTGARYRKLKCAMDAGMAIFSSHLPLDAHPVVGNAAQLAKALGLRRVRPYFPYKGECIGVRGEISVSREVLHERLGKAVDGGNVIVCPAGPEKVRCVGIVTGGAGGEIGEVGGSGVDTFITGEGPHWSYTAAEELGMNVFYAGHYATETFGVKALAAHLSRKFRLPWEFIDHPTGL